MRPTYALAMLMAGLASCGTTKVVDKPRTVTVTVPVVVAVPKELLEDCPAAALAGTKVGDITARLAAVESSLSQCRYQLSRLRALQPPTTLPVVTP